MPRSTLMAAVRDRIRRANGLIPSNGFPLGQQLVTVKAGHLPPMITRRGIDHKKCKLLSTRQTPRLRSTRVISNQSHRRDQFNAQSLGCPRIHPQSLPKEPIVAPVTNARRQSLSITSIAHMRRAGGPIEPQGRASHNEQKNVAFPHADSTRRQCLLGSITNLALRTATRSSA